MKKILTITPLFFILFAWNANAQSQIDFENVPNVGSFQVAEVQGVNPGEKVDLVCLSENNDTEIHTENVSINEDASLQEAIQIHPEDCTYRYYAFRMTDISQNERYSYPFAHLIDPPTEKGGEKIPNIWSANAVYLDDQGNIQLNILSSTINYYLISGDVVDENTWKNYSGDAILFQIANPEETSTVYITFANNNVMKTLTIRFHPELGSSIEADLIDFVEGDEAKAFAKLLTGQELSKKDITNIFSPEIAAKDYLDPDNDGLTSDQELKLGTDPEDEDSDNDGWSDGKEVLLLGTDPLAVEITDELRFLTVQDNQQVQKNSAFISGRGRSNANTVITFHDAETDQVIFRTEVQTDNEGVFRFMIPRELENRNYTIEAQQEGVKTTVNNITLKDTLEALNYTVDAINEVEIPLKLKETVLLKIKENDPITLYGTISAKLIPEDIKIVVNIENEEMNEAAEFMVKKNSLGLFAINLPIKEAGKYQLTVQSSNSTGLGPLTPFPLEVQYTENGSKYIQKQTKELNYPLLAFIAFVGTLSIYTFYFHRKKQ